MKKLALSFWLLAFSLSACMDLNVIPVAESTDIPSSETAILQGEDASGAVVELPDLKGSRPSRCMVVTALVSLNVREEPRGTVIGWLLHGEEVTAGAESGAWVHVSTVEIEGWSYGAYLAAECDK